MSDYTTSVGMDISDYERPLKQLIATVHRFNEESERGDRIQHMVAENTKRTSNVFVKYEDLLKRVGVAERARNRDLERTGIVSMEAEQKIARLQSQLAKATPATLQYKHLGDAISGILPKVSAAHAKLKELHDQNSHLRAMKGMDFGLGTVNDLIDMGAPAKVVRQARRLAEQARKQWEEVFADPEFQRLMRLDNMMDNSKTAMSSMRQNISNLHTALQPYIQSSQEALSLQREMNIAVNEEAHVRGRLAHAKDLEFQQTLEQMMIEKGVLAESSMHRMGIMAGDQKRQELRQLSLKHVGDLGPDAPGSDRIQQEILRRRFEQELFNAGDHGHQEVLNAFNSTDPNVAANAREMYRPLYDAQEALMSHTTNFHKRMGEAQERAGEDGYREMEEEVKRTKLLRQREADEAMEAERRKVLEHKSMQSLMPRDAKFGTVVQVSRAQEDLAAAYAKTGLAAEHFEEIISKIRRGDVATIRSHRDVAQALRRVEVAAHDTDRTMQRLSITNESIARLILARALTHVFYGMTTEMYETWDAANEVSKKIAEIQTISQKIPQSISQWKTGIRDLSIEYAFPQEDVGKALYETISNQIAEGSQAIDFGKIVAPFAITTASSLEDSLNLISSALNSFQLEAADAEKVAAQLFSTIDLGRVTATDMANTYGRVGTMAKQSGIDMAEMNAMIAQLTISGVKFERASTFVVNVLNKLAKPTPAFKQFLGEQGAPSGEAAIAMFGLPGVLRKIFDANQGSLEDLGEMVQDIRAMIGYSGLLSDLDQLDSTIDEIANHSMDHYSKGMKTSMESSYFIVAREGQKIRAQFIDIQGAILDTLAAINQLGPGLSKLAQGGMVFSGLFGAFTAGETIRRFSFSGQNKEDILRTGLNQFQTATAEGAGLSVGQRLAQRSYKSFAKEKVAGAAVPGLGSAAALMAPSALMGLTAGASITLLAGKTAPMWELFIDHMVHGQIKLSEEVLKNFEKIKEASQETAKASAATQKETVAELTKEYADYAAEGERILANYRHNFEKSIDLIERKAKAETSMLGATGDFLLGRDRQNSDQFIASLRRPEDQLTAKGNFLVNQRDRIGSVIGQDPELGNQFFGEWLKDIESLRGEIFSFANENPGRAGEAGDFLAMVDQMTNQAVSSFAEKFGITSSGDTLKDVLAIRKEVSSQEEQTVQFAELKKFLEKKIEDGVQSWQSIDEGVRTLNDTQQKLFDEIISPNKAGNDLAYTAAQAGRNEQKQREGRQDVLVEKQRDRMTEFPNELNKSLSLDETSPLGLLNKQIELATAHLDKWIGSDDADSLRARRADLQERIGKYTEGVATAGGVTQPLAVEAAAIIDAFHDLGQDISTELRGESGIRKATGLYRSDIYAGRIEETLSNLTDLGFRANVLARPDAEQYAGLLRPTGSDFDLNARQKLRSDLTLGAIDANNIRMQAGNVILDVGQMDVDPRLADFTHNPQYNAMGGPIAGPRGTDTVPAWLTPGEYVVNARSAAKHRGLLEQLNNAQYFEGGGRVLDMEALEEWRKNRSSSYINQGPRQMGLWKDGKFTEFKSQRRGRKYGSINHEENLQWKVDDFFERYADQIAYATEQQNAKRAAKGGSSLATTMRAYQGMQSLGGDGASYDPNFSGLAGAGSKIENLISTVINELINKLNGGGEARPFSMFPDDDYTRSVRGFSTGGLVPRSPRAFNQNPSYHSAGGAVSNNSNVFNATINLTGSGSNSADVREIARGLKREFHRGTITLQG